MKQEDLVATYSSRGSHLLVSQDSFAVFGNESTDDMVLIGKHQVRNAVTALYKRGVRQEVPIDALLNLFQKVASLRMTSANAIFTIYSEDMRRIKDSIKSLDATHLRVWSAGTGVTVTIFDCRDLDFDRRIGRKNSMKLNYLELETRSGNKFTFTFNAESFKKLPPDDCNFRIGTNGVCEVTSVNDATSYLLRDQKLVEPVTVFDSASAGKKICFLFHPS